jgi:hypothetical protein
VLHSDHSPRDAAAAEVVHRKDGAPLRTPADTPTERDEKKIECLIINKYNIINIEEAIA